MHIPADVHVGKVDHVDGQYLKLAKNSTEDAHHHWIPLSWIESVSEQGVFLNKNVEEYMWGRLDESPVN
ncbi:MAG: DUF2171 domain-containing protein [Proteobacteria bacterium]|nr:MAG: DUF2171 domain-containing protein [Pseudomonadota bacterium]